MTMQRASSGGARRRHRGPRRAQSRGMVLVIALILLVVIGISSSVAIRTSLFGDLVSQNMRAQALALEAAELALRYCESQVAAGNYAAISVIEGGTDDEWRTESNWDTANSVPASVLGSNINYAVTPQCMVKRMSYAEAFPAENVPPNAKRIRDRLEDGEEYVFIFRITARGYSPDFRRDGDGRPVSGAQVTVQSALRAIL